MSGNYLALDISKCRNEAQALIEKIPGSESWPEEAAETLAWVGYNNKSRVKPPIRRTPTSKKQMPEADGHLLSVYDKQIREIVPHIRAAMLPLIYRMTPKEHRQKVPISWTYYLLKDTIVASLGKPRKTPHYYVNRLELLDAVGECRKVKNVNSPSARRAAKAYLKVMIKMGLISIANIEDKYAKVWSLRFENLDQWAQSHLNWMRADKQVDADDFKVFMKILGNVNVLPWKMLVPTKRAIPTYVPGSYYDGGSAPNVKSVPVTPRSWARYIMCLFVETIQALRNGGAEYHPRDERALQKVNFQRKAIRNDDNITKAEEELTEWAQEEVETLDPGRRAWLPSNERNADLWDMGVTTFKNYVRLRISTKAIPRSKLIGIVEHDDAGRLKDAFENYDQPQPRLTPVNSQFKNTYYVQVDLPNRVEFRKGRRNWRYSPQPFRMYHQPWRTKPHDVCYPDPPRVDRVLRTHVYNWGHVYLTELTPKCRVSIREQEIQQHTLPDGLVEILKELKVVYSWNCWRRVVTNPARGSHQPAQSRRPNRRSWAATNHKRFNRLNWKTRRARETRQRYERKLERERLEQYRPR